MPQDPFVAKARLASFLGIPLLAAFLTALAALGGGVSWLFAAALMIPAAALLVLFSHSSWYVCKAVPLSASGGLRPVLTNLAAAAVIGTLWAVGVIGLAELAANALRQAAWSETVLTGTLHGADGRVAIHTQMFLLAGVGALYYLLGAAYNYLLLALAQSRDAERRVAEARLLAQDSELKALKAQVNPHFLFNSLHSISALTASDPEKAREMCILLSDFLRQTLGLGERPGIPLRDELSLLNKYMSVEKVRFGDRLQYLDEVEAGVLDCQVPPLLLQPMVENAIKHGVASLLGETRVALSAEKRGEFLWLRLENDFDPEAARARSNGMGLKNAERRLRTAYGEEASLSARAEGNRFRVTITLPARQAGKEDA